MGHRSKSRTMFILKQKNWQMSLQRPEPAKCQHEEFGSQNYKPTIQGFDGQMPSKKDSRLKDENILLRTMY